MLKLPKRSLFIYLLSDPKWHANICNNALPEIGHAVSSGSMGEFESQALLKYMFTHQSVGILFWQVPVTFHPHWINNAGPLWTLEIERFAVQNTLNYLIDFTNESPKYLIWRLILWQYKGTRLETAVPIVLFIMRAYQIGRLVILNVGCEPKSINSCFPHSYRGATTHLCCAFTTIRECCCTELLTGRRQCTRRR